MGLCCCNAANGAHELAIPGSAPRRAWGWKKDPHDPRDKFLCFSPAVKANLPPSVDLRKQQAFDIYDQGSLGSCTANALAAAFQHEQLRQGFKTWMPSRLFIYWCERNMEGSVGEDAGAYIRDGIKCMVKYGVCPESMWPYDEGRFRDRPNEQAYVEAEKNQVLEYARVNQTLEDMKACISSGYPIVFGFVVYSSFQCCWTMLTGKMTMPGCCGDAAMGGHAVQACGYDDERQVFIVRNSWGPHWGDAGHFYMPYAYILNPDLAEDFWAIRAVEGVPFPAQRGCAELEVAAAGPCTPLCA